MRRKYDHLRSRLVAAIHRAERLNAILDKQVRAADSLGCPCGAYDHSVENCPEEHRTYLERSQDRFKFYPRPVCCKECGAYDHVTDRHVPSMVRRWQLYGVGE